MPSTAFLKTWASCRGRLGLAGQLNQQLLNAVLTSPSYGGHYRYVALWAFSGTGRVFIQDANSLMLPTDLLVEALQLLANQNTRNPKGHLLRPQQHSGSKEPRGLEGSSGSRLEPYPYWPGKWFGPGARVRKKGSNFRTTHHCGREE